LRNLGATLARYRGLVESAVIALAVALLLYLPVEPLLLSGLSGAPYWALRLLPDALVALAAAAVILIPGDKRREAVVILWALAVVSVAVIMLDAVRGFSPGTTINALRVLLRYAVLGAALLAIVHEPSSTLRKFAWAIVVAAVVQFAAAVIQFSALLWPMVSGTSKFSVYGLLGVGGLVGRYDRLGFLMTAAVLMALAGAAPGPRKLGRILLVIGIAGLALSSSRQALLGLALGACLLAVLPRLALRVRASHIAVAGLAVALIVLLPVPTNANQLPDPDAQASASFGQTTPGARGGLELSVDPARNFRLYYNLKFLPWAATQQPLLGFGPAEQNSTTPNPALKAKMEAEVMPWAVAVRYTNDSNYTSMVIQFGAFLPLLFLAFIGGLALWLLRGLWRGADERWLAFALAYCVACGVGAAFGPAFEIRTVSVVLWLGLFGGLLLLRPPLRSDSPSLS
jgi:hypothetical protein